MTKWFNWLCEAWNFLIKLIPYIKSPWVWGPITVITTKINGTITIPYWYIPAYTSVICALILIVQALVNNFDNKKILISDVLDKAKEDISHIETAELEKQIVNELIAGKIDLYGLDCKRNDGVLECISNEKVQYLKYPSGKLHFKDNRFEQEKGFLHFDGTYASNGWQNLYTKVSITKKDTSKLLNELKRENPKN
jgi:hypothetical protein